MEFITDDCHKKTRLPIFTFFAVRKSKKNFLYDPLATVVYVNVFQESSTLQLIQRNMDVVGII